MHLYVVRHGQTTWNLVHRCQGVSDIPLTEQGIKQAKSLQPLVAKLDLDVVISSPLSRAYDTAKIITNNKIPIVIDKRIIERDWGKNEGLIIDNIDRINCWNVNLNIGDNEIEKLQDFMNRISEFIEDIRIKYKDKKVLVVAHSAVLRVIHYLLGQIPEDGDLTRIDIPNLRILEYELK